MAISKILNSNSPSKGSNYTPLRNGINYVLNPVKTDGGKYTGSVNCIMENAANEMIYTKELYGKTGGRQSYHIVISFNKEENNKDEAFLIMKEFTERYLGERFEAVYSLHTNTDHLHGHIVWNSVSFADSIKYHYNNGDWAKYIQPLVDRICREHGFEDLKIKSIVNKKIIEETIEQITKKHGKYCNSNKNSVSESDTLSVTAKNKYRNENNEKNFVNWSKVIKRDIDSLIYVSENFNDLIERLKNKGYELHIKNRKHISVKPPGMARFRRLDSGSMEGYSPESIENKINERKHIERVTGKKINPLKEYYVAGNTLIALKENCKVDIMKTTKQIPEILKMQRYQLMKLAVIRKKPLKNMYSERNILYKYKKIWDENEVMINYKIVGPNDIKVAIKSVENEERGLIERRKKYTEKTRKLTKLFQTVKRMNELIERNPELQNNIMDADISSEDLIELNSLNKTIEELGMDYSFAKKVNEAHLNQKKQFDKQRMKIKAEKKALLRLTKKYEVRERKIEPNQQKRTEYKR